MPSPRILIAYGTSHGHTAKVARYLAELLTAEGDVVTLANLDQLPRMLRLCEFDGVLVGSSILFGQNRRSVRRFVRAYHDVLNIVPSAFFSVSGSAGSRDEAKRAEARMCVDAFLRETGWHPRLTELVGGAIAYTKYGPLLRWVARLAAQKSGGPTDTTRDHEFTDWEAVRRFAQAFAASLPRADAPTTLAVT